MYVSLFVLCRYYSYYQLLFISVGLIVSSLCTQAFRTCTVVSTINLIGLLWINLITNTRSTVILCLRFEETQNKKAQFLSYATLA